MAFIAILTSVISASYYLRIVVLLVTSPSSNKEQSSNITDLNNSFNNETLLTNFHSFLISTITLSILLFIFKPTLLLNSTTLLSLYYFYF